MDLERGLLRHISLASTAVGAFLCVALPVASPAQAQAADGNMLNSVTNFFSAPFGGGKPAPAEDNDGVIDYRPRPALVVPPTNDLPPPQPAAARSPDWPKDPDAAALRKAKADSRRPAPKAAVAGPEAPQAEAPAPAKRAADDLRTLPEGSLDPLWLARTMTAPAKDDSPAAGDAAPGQSVYLPPEGPNCNSVAGMPMCFTAPWGQEVALPGAVKGGGGQGVRLRTSASRKYLIDPPVTYLEAVPISQNAPGNAQAQGGQKPTGAAAAPAPGEKKPPSKCMFPGWFGCPEQTPAVQLSQRDPAIGQTQGAQPAAGATASAETGGPGSQPAAKKCMFPGWFGCPEQRQVVQLSQGDSASGQTQGAQPAAGATASAEIGGPASQPAAKTCMFPGWFGCPER
ncbi:MAG: hypothetical protein WCF20_11645 [Methylovirgula sp.]